MESAAKTGRRVSIIDGGGQSKPDDLPLSLGKPATVLIAGFARQLHGGGEIQADFFRGVGVGAEGDRHAFLKRKLEKRTAGINLPAVFAQPGSVEFDGAAGPGGGGEEGFVKRRAVARRAMAELFRQI